MLQRVLPFEKSQIAREIGLGLDRLFNPINIMPLVYFRMAFGAIMLWEVWRYSTYGWISSYYIEPTFYFSYFGFEWVKPLPGIGMYVVFAALAVLAALILVGLFYRMSAALFWLCFTYVFLLDQTRYLNHFYLISLISFLLIVLPAADNFSLDALRRPAQRTTVVPLWTLYLLRFQLGVVYFFGGVAKLNGDWLQGEPMRMWLATRTDFPLIGQWFTEEGMVYAFSYGALLFDLLFVPLVLWRWTRIPALIVSTVFHLSNAHLFSIGIFPWFMIAASVVFLPPKWWARLHVGWQTTSSRENSAQPVTNRQLWVLFWLGVYIGIQVLMPLRHFLYPGDVNWTEEGHKFAWHMKLRDKAATIRFFVTDPQTQAVWEVDPRQYLTRAQINDMAAHPEMILQFSHFLAGVFANNGVVSVEVRVLSSVSLNGRRRQAMIDPQVNLAAQPRSLLASNWILPLDEPLSAP